ncbi:hypothetical protein LTR53_019802, partial [Teratosphaeriaceae sp. CCFEE 6253]
MQVSEPQYSPRHGASPSHEPGRDEEEAWSGDDDDDDDGLEGPARKRQRTGRPISVSCE